MSVDPSINPYAPGAGTAPPELAGRGPLLGEIETALRRARAGLAANGVVLHGLRGVGKTVLLNRIEQQAEEDGLGVVSLEAAHDRSLPSLLASPLKAALLRMSARAAARDLVARAGQALRGFVGSMKVRFEGVEIGLDTTAEPGLADSGDLSLDLGDLLRTVGEAARAQGTAVVLVADELHCLPGNELGALLQSLHRMSQRQLPVILVGAALPQIVGRAGRSKSYAERLLDFREVGALDARAAGVALRAPAKRAEVAYEPGAIREIVRRTEGYPYFLQAWGKHCWNCAARTPITVADVREATNLALASLDAGFFRMRIDRLTLSQKRYLRAMAALGAGPHRSGEIAAVLGRRVTTLGPVRAKLIEKGMLYGPAHGLTAFTVPMFDRYLQRVAPDGFD